MTGIVGAHVYWTRPRKTPAPYLSKLDTAVLVASATMWRAMNGPTWLFTDPQGLRELSQLGLIGLWDQVDLNCLEEIPTDIDASAFWDLGKTFALSQLPSDGCLLDLDLVIWNAVQHSSDTVSFLHWESPKPPWYLGPDELSVPPAYAFDTCIDWNAPACNTAFMRCPDLRLRHMFLEAALFFARGNRPANSGIAEMLFAGQRMLAHLIRASASKPLPMIDYLYDPCGQSRWLVEHHTVDDPLTPEACDMGVTFTHLWKHKHTIRGSEIEETFFHDLERRCQERTGIGLKPWFST